MWKWEIKYYTPLDPDPHGFDNSFMAIIHKKIIDDVMSISQTQDPHGSLTAVILQRAYSNNLVSYFNYNKTLDFDSR